MWDGTAMVRSFRKNYIILFAYLSVVPAMGAGYNNEEHFLRGNAYYKEKKYDKAFAEYDIINKKGRAVLFNMGNCLFHMNDYPRALVYWSRAEIGATPREYRIILRNKEIAFKKLGISKKKDWCQNCAECAQSYVSFVSLFLLQIFFLLCLWMCVFLMYGKQTKSKKMIRWFLYFCLTMCTAILLARYVYDNNQRAIVIKKEGKLLTGPDKSFEALALVPYADEVKIKQAREGWYKIQYAGMIGWVEADIIQVI